MSILYTDVLVMQLQAFQRRWTGMVSSNGTAVLTDAALKEITNIQVHMEKGCLTGMTDKGNKCFTQTVRYITIFLHTQESNLEGEQTVMKIYTRTSIPL